MPVVMFTVGELFSAGLEQARKLADEILALANLEARPLNPGESVEARHHKIAKLGKQLAEVFKSVDNLVEQAHAQHAHAHDQAPTTNKPDDPGAN